MNKQANRSTKSDSIDNEAALLPGLKPIPESETFENLSSEEIFEKYVDVEEWQKGNQAFADNRLIDALTALGFENVRRTQTGSIITDDDCGMKPRFIAKLIMSHMECSFAKSVHVQRNHGHVRYAVQIHDAETIRKQIAEGRYPKPLTEDRDIPLSDRDTTEDDLRMGEIYMYVYDMFNAAYGVYPEKLVNREDYTRLGRMMNLAIAGESFAL